MDKTNENQENGDQYSFMRNYLRHLWEMGEEAFNQMLEDSERETRELMKEFELSSDRTAIEWNRQDYGKKLGHVIGNTVDLVASRNYERKIDPESIRKPEVDGGSYLPETKQQGELTLVKLLKHGEEHRVIGNYNLN